MSYAEGGALNPAFAAAQSTYTIAYNKDLLGQFFNNVWYIYLIFPFVGAVLAAVFFFGYKKIEGNEDEEEEDPNETIERARTNSRASQRPP